MLAVSHPSFSSLHSRPHRAMDEPGTINPAALNASASTIAPNLLSQPSPRGTKRGRSPDADGTQDQESDAAGDAQASKRSRPLKQEEEASPSMSYASAQPVQTPHIKTQSLPQSTPSQTSPARSTPGSATKPAVVKALPTVRDHTTDQLGPGGDEYIPRETDPDGETKVSKDGYPQNGRKYRTRTFQVPDRGEKLFMLATECARVLGYRDSYLLFNKNRSLYKIIANSHEKNNLIEQDILPYSYRSRQIAIVTARSMFRQFGSRLIMDGRRVRDDYWEAKARKQGFTEEDAAGEKRPGAAKAREAAAAETSHATLTSLPQGEIIYSNGPGMDGQPPIGQVSLAPLPMIHLVNDELRPNQYGNVPRPRQEITGPPYQDRIPPSNPADILSQAAQATEYNKGLSLTRKHRADFLDNIWKRPHEQPAVQTSGEGDMTTIAPQHLQSPQAVDHRRSHPDQMAHAGAQMMPQNYGSYPNQQNPMASSPIQQMHRMAPGQMHPSTPMAPGSNHRQSMSYPNYPQPQMWPPPQPQPSPLSQSHHVAQYGQQQQHHSPMGPPQIPQQQQMNYAQMNAMGNPAFAGMNRSMYQQSPGPQQQFGMQSGAGQQAGIQGWSNPGASSAGGMPQDWGRYQ